VSKTSGAHHVRRIAVTRFRQGLHQVDLGVGGSVLQGVADQGRKVIGVLAVAGRAGHEQRGSPRVRDQHRRSHEGRAAESNPRPIEVEALSLRPPFHLGGACHRSAEGERQRRGAVLGTGASAGQFRWLRTAPEQSRNRHGVSVTAAQRDP
jgi:hypothetical protein